MKKPLHSDIRALLRANPDGLTVAEICKTLGLKVPSVAKSLTYMPDSYIDRWNINKVRGSWVSAVWCVVPVPENYPKPNRQEYLERQKSGNV